MASHSGSLSAAKTRTVDAAAVLFAERGVGGTSLQMIADAVGVTKAAIYFQFKTKDEIVLAVAESELRRLEAALDEAEASGEQVQEVLIARMVDIAVERRRMVGNILGDPAVAPLLASHDPFRKQMDRMYRLLMGDDFRAEDRLRAAMLTAAISGAVIHPIAIDLDDDTLRSQLVQLARRFLDLPDAQPR